MARKTDAYVDTSALIAFSDRSDSFHPLFRRLFAMPPRVLLTTPMVVAEGHGWFLKRYDRYRALQFLAMIEIMPLTVVEVGTREQHAAVEILRRFSDQDLTLVDALGLHVMAAKDVVACWSTDFHLSVTGVPLVVHG